MNHLEREPSGSNCPSPARNPYLWVVVIAGVVILFKALLFLAFPPGWLSPVELKLEVRLEGGGPASRKDDVYLQVYQNTGKGLNEMQSRRIPVVASGEYEWTRIVLPYREWEAIRLDGPAHPGVFAIRSVRLIADEETLTWEGGDLREVLTPSGQISEIGSDGSGGLLFRSLGNDPQFAFAVSAPDPVIFGGESVQRLILPMGVSFCVLVLFGWGVVFLYRIWREMRRPGEILAGLRGVIVGTGLVAVVVIYSAFGTQAEKNAVPQHMAGHNLYFHLTESYLHGKVHLLEEPLRPLLELENPFDPEANQGLRLHDATFFDNRYFVYFGPAPVVSLYLPWRILTGTDLSDRWADAVLLSGAFLFLFFTVLRTRRLLPGKMSGGSLLVSFLALGLTTGALFLMGRSVVYEVALSSACFWMSVAVFLTLEGLSRERSLKPLFFAGLALGMAMGSRHSFVLASFFFVGSVFLFLCLRGRPWSDGIRRMLALALPAGAIGLLLLVHNFVRFGDPMEFGHNFQIGLVDPQEVEFLDAGNIPYNLVINLFQPPEFYPPFPWIHLRGQDLLDWIAPPDSHIRVETGLGLLVANPYLLLLPFLIPWRFPGGWDRRPLWIFSVVSGIALINFLVIALFSYSAPRYSVDYAPWLILLFVLLWSIRDAKNPVGWRHRLLGWLLIPALLWSISVHFGLALDRIL